MFDFNGDNQYTFAVCHGKNGFLQLQFPQMRPPFDQPGPRAELVAKLEQATGVQFGPYPKYPSIKFTSLTHERRLSDLLDVALWIISETRKASGSE
jgi:hypothetical protein